MICGGLALIQNADRPVLYRRPEFEFYPLEQRIKAVKWVLFRGKKTAEIAKKFGCKTATLRSWIRKLGPKLAEENPDVKIRYQLGRKWRMVTEKQKVQAVKKVVFDGMTRAEVAKQLGLSKNAVGPWVRLYADRVKAENPKRKPVERDFWRRKFPLKERKKAVNLVLRKGMSTKKVGEMFGCHAVTVQHWVKELGR